MAAIDAQKPVATALGSHQLEVLSLNAVGTADILEFSLSRPLNHGLTAAFREASLCGRVVELLTPGKMRVPMWRISADYAKTTVG